MNTVLFVNATIVFSENLFLVVISELWKCNMSCKYYQLSHFIIDNLCSGLERIFHYKAKYNYVKYCSKHGNILNFFSLSSLS